MVKYGGDDGPLWSFFIQAGKLVQGNETCIVAQHPGVLCCGVVWAAILYFLVFYRVRYSSTPICSFVA